MSDVNCAGGNENRARPAKMGGDLNPSIDSHHQCYIAAGIASASVRHILSQHGIRYD
jgi:hypothetical protein